MVQTSKSFLLTANGLFLGGNPVMVAGGEIRGGDNNTANFLQLRKQSNTGEKVYYNSAATNTTVSVDFAHAPIYFPDGCYVNFSNQGNAFVTLRIV